MLALGLSLALLIGLSLGLLGGGGSILTVPILVYVAGFEPKQGIALSLIVVGTTSLAGAASHWRTGNVKWRMALAFGALAMVGGYAGARASTLVTGEFQLAIFAIVMLAAAGFMFRGRRELATPTTPHPLVVVPTALGVGFLTGFVGVGGGFMIVPALTLLVGLDIKQAIGTSLVVIALNCASGFAGYWGQVHVPWLYLSAFTAVAIVGSVIGARAQRRVSQGALRRGFAVFLVVVGALILYKNSAALVHARPPAAAAGP